MVIINIRNPVSGLIESLEVNQLDNVIEPGWLVTLKKGIIISIYFRNGIWKTKSGEELHYDVAQSIGDEINRSQAAAFANPIEVPHRKPRPRLVKTALL